MSNKKILRLPDVLNRIGLKRSTVYAQICEGSFPKQVKLGTRSVGWLEEEVEDWLKKRIALSRSAATSNNGSGGKNAA